jgi:alcohol dehydrogenase class IV
VPHGVANAIVLPHVIRFNAAAGPEVAERYSHVAEALGRPVGPEAADELADHVAGLRDRLGLPGHLSEVGVPAGDVRDLAEAAMGDVCTLVNPREPTARELEQLFERAL